MVIDNKRLRVNAGFCSRTGRRDENQDYVGLCTGAALELNAAGQVAVIADGVSHGDGGRVAAELTVRGFLDGYYSASPTVGVAQNAVAVMAALNGWLHAIARDDTRLKHASTTFTALVLQGRSAHVLHAGDTRAYHLHEDQLTRLTLDHTLSQPDLNHVLSRAVGMEASIRLDHRVQSLRIHDRLVLCTDGVHATLDDRRLRELLLRRGAPTEDAERIVEAALDSGSQDNASCVIIDVLDVPEAAAPELQHRFALLPIEAPPSPGDSVDGFLISQRIAEGHYSRLLRATDTETGAEVVLKFPQANVASAATYRLAFVREAWVAARLHSPYVGEVIELPVDRQTRLYSAMPFYAGETLEQRLLRQPRPSLKEAMSIALKLCKALAVLHRAGVIHRDIKPDNVLLENAGGLRLIDLGVVRLPRMEDFPVGDIPGTPSYMAPELFDGESGSELSDQFALGVTLYRLLSRRYPYGEIEPFSRPRFTQAAPLSRYRPDLPAWLEHLLARATDPDPRARYSDILELAMELESGLAQGAPRQLRRLSLYERDPLRFWKTVAALLAIGFAASVAVQVLGHSLR